MDAEIGVSEVRRKPTILVLLAAGAVLATTLGAGTTNAQTLQLESRVITSPSPDIGAIRNYVSSFRAPLVEGPLEKIGTARNAVLRPLEETNASVGFLTAYSSEIEPILKAMIDTGDPLRTFNALRIGGELATDTALDIVTDKLDAENPTDRYAAASAIGRTFNAVRTRNTMTSSQVNELVEALEDVWTDDANEVVARGAVKSLRTGASVTRLDGVRENALLALIRGGTSRAIAIDENPKQRSAMLETLLGTADELRRAAVLDRSISRRVLDESSVFAAHLVGQAFRSFAEAGNSASDVPAEEYEVQLQLLRAADAILVSSIGWEQPLSEDAYDAKTEQGDQNFKSRVVELAERMGERRGFDKARMLGE